MISHFFIFKIHEVFVNVMIEDKLLRTKFLKGPDHLICGYGYIGC